MDDNLHISEEENKFLGEMEKAHAILQGKIDEYKALDISFINACEKANVHPVAAYMTLITVHGEVAEGMKQALSIITSGFASGDDNDTIKSALEKNFAADEAE